MKTLIAFGEMIRTNHHWKRAMLGLYSVAAFALVAVPLESHWK